MKASGAIALMLAGSMSVFGLYHRHAVNPALPPGPEPVWVNGVMGVYDPDTREFVASESPKFNQTCDRIQELRAINSGSSYTTNHYYDSGYSGYNHHWYHSSGSPYLLYSSSSSSSSSGSSNSSGRSSFVSTSHSTSSARGGIGASGHAASGGG